jgi:osmotically-inducible protein OsmY
MSPDAGQRAEADNCLAARLHEALAMDARVGELHLSVIVDGQAVAVTGKVATEARRTAVEEVVREVAPGRSLDNQVEVLS